MLETLELHHILRGFPSNAGAVAELAATQVLTELATRQWTELESFSVGEEKIWIPARLRFSDTVVPPSGSETSLMVCAMLTRSFDGYQRQQAARVLLPELEAWSAPFILFLIGEWIAEILEDIELGLTNDCLRVLAQCAAENPAYWQTTKRRVQSYWNVFYQRRYSRKDYPGFKLVARVEAA